MKRLKTIQAALLPFLITAFFCFHSDSSNAQDLARYTPEWIKDGFADGGAFHEPWFYQIRRKNDGFNMWTKETFDYLLSEEYISSLAEAGVDVYHLFCYKGFGFEAEKESMERAAGVAKIARKYGMKVDTYIQWNTMGYETFLNEVPEAAGPEPWYQIDVNGKPILLQYGFQQSFRYRPCFNHDDYMEYFKEKILRYAVEEIGTDFIHFDNFDLNRPRDADHNPVSIRAFRDYVTNKYTAAEREERFGFSDVSNILPPIWNASNPAGEIVVINDPVLQEWTDFRCWTMNTRLAECARFVRKLKKEVVIECNPHGLIGTNRMWDAGIDHASLMQYTNVIWTEDNNNPRWAEGVAVGKFRHYKLGRTTNNYILTYNGSPQDWAENMALNRTVAWIGAKRLPEGTTKQYLDFWLKHKDLYNNSEGAEKVAVLRSYPSMAYNRGATQVSVNTAEQAIQQMQIPFDIIFDQQMDKLDKYSVLVLANQESLSDENLESVIRFVRDGGGLIVTKDTGLYDKWRRRREKRGFHEIFEQAGIDWNDNAAEAVSVEFGQGKAVYFPELVIPAEFHNKTWKVPENLAELEAAILYVSNDPLPLTVDAPGWIGVSHDRQQNRDIVHLFNYKENNHVDGIILKYRGKVKNVWSVSPNREDQTKIDFENGEETAIIRIPGMDVYEILVIEK